MKTITQYITVLSAVLALMLANTNEINAQCSNFDYAYPAATQSTTSNTLVTVTTAAYAGNWATYNVTSGETYTWTTCGDANFDTQLTLWNTAHTTSYAYNDDDCGPQSTITWTATFTGQVDVLVSEYNCSNNADFMTVQWACTSCGAPSTPPNNLCSGSTNLPCGTSGLAGTTSGTTSTAYGTGCSISDYGVWYTFTGDGDNTTITADPEAGYDIEMSIASGSCGGLTNIACEDAELSGDSEYYTFTTTNGVDYLVYISYWSSSAGATDVGDFTISRSCTTPPVSTANDDCSGATSLPCATINLAGTTVGSTSLSDQAGCASSSGVWYSFVGDGQSTTISSSATFDHEMVIYSGSCGSLTNVACKDGSTGTENYTFTPANGVTYYVYIAHWSTSSSTTGTFTISRTCANDIIPTVCANDTYTLDPSTSANFYDDGGSGGDCNVDEAPGNFANAGCETITTICAAPGEYLIANFSVFSMFGTDDGFDWMVIYEGPSASGTILFDNRSGAVNNPVGTNCNYAGSLNLCAIGRCLTFRFNGTSAVSREGWDAVVMSVPDECAPLPVNLVDFKGRKEGNINQLTWKTASETNNDYFVLEHSVDGKKWETIQETDGAGNSTEENNYSFDHNRFPKKINYYRLTQVDYDGKREEFNIISIDNSTDRTLIKRVNVLGQEVGKNYKGIVIEYYDDNTQVKRYQK